MFWESRRCEKKTSNAHQSRRNLSTTARFATISGPERAFCAASTHPMNGRPLTLLLLSLGAYSRPLTSSTNLIPSHIGPSHPQRALGGIFAGLVGQISGNHFEVSFSLLSLGMLSPSTLYTNQTLFRLLGVKWTTLRGPDVVPLLPAWIPAFRAKPCWDPPPPNGPAPLDSITRILPTVYTVLSQSDTRPSGRRVSILASYHPTAKYHAC